MRPKATQPPSGPSFRRCTTKPPLTTPTPPPPPQVYFQPGHVYTITFYNCEMDYSTFKVGPHSAAAALKGQIRTAVGRTPFLCSRSTPPLLCSLQQHLFTPYHPYQPLPTPPTPTPHPNQARAPLLGSVDMIRFLNGGPSMFMCARGGRGAPFSAQRAGAPLGKRRTGCTL